MQTVDLYKDGVFCYLKRALERMPVRSSTMGRRMVEAKLPPPESTDDIERYLHDSLAKE